jgi:type I restriction enzyme S subunit
LLRTLSHDRLLIGYAAIVPKVFGEVGIASHHVYRVSIRPGSPFQPTFLCNLLNSRRMHDTVSGYANGTTVNMLPEDGLQMPLAAVPPSPLIQAFERLTSNSERRNQDIVAECNTLLAMRDTLLPKLISGELRVKDAERFLAERGL